MNPLQTEDGFTEWYDDTDPPNRGVVIHEEDLSGKVWSDLQAGDRVRWKTATFVKRGAIVAVKKRSMTVLFDAHSRPTTIPDAKWYFAEGKVGNLNEHLTCISTPYNPMVKMNGDHRIPAEVFGKPSQGMSMDPKDVISPNEAANILGTDPKNIRRMIRSGKLRAMRVGGRWVLSRKEVEAR